MSGCKQQILASIPSNSCCSHAFLAVVIDFCGFVDTQNSRLLISAPDIVCEKAIKIFNRFYPTVTINTWKDFLVVSGDIDAILSNCNITSAPQYDKFEKKCDQLTLLKTLFIINGNFYCELNNNQNSKGYHLEFFVKPERQDLVKNMLEKFNFDFKSKQRQNGIMFYNKHSEVICDFLVCLGAGYTALEVQNSLAMREIRNSANRQNNCFESNLDKTLSASAEQMKAINYFIDTDNLDLLDDNLKEIALLRYANPYLPLSELVNLLGKNISRAGLKYRLDKIIDIYKKNKGEN